MKSLHSLAIATFLLGLAPLSVSRAETDREIEGSWKLVAVEKDGKQLPADLIAGLPSVIVIEGARIRGMVGDKEVYAADFLVNTKTSPKTYEMKGAKDRKGRDIVTRGIYEINERGQLRKCFVRGATSTPPKAFDTKTAGSDLITYERVK